jgi:hypothetical protein
LERTRELGEAEELGSTTFIQFRDRFLQESPLEQLEQPAPGVIMGVGNYRRRLLLKQGVSDQDIDSALFFARKIRWAFDSAQKRTRDVWDDNPGLRLLETSLMIIQRLAENGVTIECSFTGYSKPFTLTQEEQITRKLTPANAELVSTSRFSCWIPLVIHCYALQVRSTSLDHIYQIAIEKREYGKKTGLGEKKADVRLEMNVAANMVFTFWVLNMAKHRYTASNFYWWVNTIGDKIRLSWFLHLPSLMLLTKRGLSRKVGLRCVHDHIQHRRWRIERVQRTLTRTLTADTT